tara:strand:+ start:9254 stop:9697 length:444 start_codon:yes stop_codon:yes gene_type:complete
MKLNLLLLFFTLLTSYSCSKPSTYIKYGNEIDTSLKFHVNIDNNFDLKNISGQIIDVCPKKGCWMNVKVGSDTVFVKFKDYNFFVPKSGIEGKNILMTGRIFRDSISIERLRHYAEDAKKTKEEIELIVDPEYKINMIAEGVAIKEN